ncbi:protein-glutamate O-methyltransferase CheR [Stakelama sediminis]|uniref:Chemotaxis protein methyltransferase n=1 Tax=Stakelama sediminis TaxID=463200 RepID=A0A840YTZ4_9SPHN|nr:protein-glutamate O-methyltransferase CheR [Stakelama sediminis]MBB5717103.1 chemotaxis protein methyltransferase CheR [Stakelama sediminis]
MNAAVQFDTMPGVSPGVYSAADFAAVRDIVHSEAGIVLPPGKAMLVYSRLSPLVRKTGSQTFANYIAHIRADDVERRRAICALTTNHTFFYREAHHFEHFAKVVRPELLKKLGRREAVRMWSAGCSTGEETWSLVMTLLGTDRADGMRIAGQDMLVLATDIATHALQPAEAATYPLEALKPVPAGLRHAWTEEKDGQAMLRDKARQMVRFRHLNLLGGWPMKAKFDVIFCRNVMIYFDQPTKERLVARFVDQLLPGGHLYIGHSERVTGPAMQKLKIVGPTIYQKVAA